MFKNLFFPKLPILLSLLLLMILLSGCEGERGDCQKFDIETETETETFDFKAITSNIGKWIDTGISVKDGSQLTMKITGMIDLCGNSTSTQEVEAVLCDDFSAPTYPTYNDPSDLAKVFYLDSNVACAHSPGKAFNRTMQYKKTGIFVKKGDKVSFQLIPERFSVGNCSNIPSNVTLEDFTYKPGKTFDSTLFCNNYLSPMQTSFATDSILYQSYLNNHFGSKGNKVFLGQVVRQNFTPMDKDIFYKIPKVYVNYFKQNLINLVDDDTAAKTRYNYYQWGYYNDLANSFLYPKQIYRSSNGVEIHNDDVAVTDPNTGKPRRYDRHAYGINYDEAADTEDKLFKLYENAEKIQDFFILQGLQIDALDNYIDNSKKMFADYQSIAQKRFTGGVGNFTYYVTTKQFWGKNIGFFVRNDRLDAGWNVIKSNQRAVADYFGIMHTSDFKKTKQFFNYKNTIDKRLVSEISTHLLNTFDYKGKKFDNLFATSGSKNHWSCKETFNIDDVKKYFEKLEQEIESKLSMLTAYGIDFHDMFEWQDFKAKFFSLHLVEGRFFCFDAGDGERFDINQIKNEIRAAYSDFVTALNSDSFLLDDTQALHLKTSNPLFPFWFRSNVADFRKITAGGSCANILDDPTDARKKFDLFSWNRHCKNICDLPGVTGSCSYTPMIATTSSPSAGNVPIFSTNYHYDKSGYYNTFANRLVAKIASDDNVNFASSGECLTKGNTASCAKQFSNFSDSLRLGKEYVVKGDGGELMLIIAHDDEYSYAQSYGGYNVQIEHSCKSANGQGLYYYIGTRSDTLNKTPKDLSSKTFTDLLGTDGQGVLTGNKNGNLYVFMEDRKGSSGYEGNYNISAKSTNLKAPISNILNPIFDLFESKLYGVRNNNGEYIKDGIAKKFYDGFLTQGGYLQAIQALLVVFICITTMGYMTGILAMDRSDLIIRLFKISAVTILIGPKSWEFFNAYMFTLLRDGSAQLVEAVMSNSTILTGNRFLIYDRIANYVLNKQTWERIGMMFLIFPTGFFAFWFLLLSVIDIIILLFKGLIIYFSAVFVTAILLGLSPLYIPFILFNLTRKLFDGWLKQLISYALIPVFYFASITICFAVLETALSIVFNFEYCMECGYWLNFGDIIYRNTGDNWSYLVNIFFLARDDGPNICVFDWPKPKGGIPFTFSAVMMLYILTAVTGKIVKLSHSMAASIIGFLPNAGSVADLGDKVTGQMEKAVGLDSASKNRRATAAKHANARKQQIKGHMDNKADKFKQMNQFYDKSKDKNPEDFAKSLGEKRNLTNEDKGELWQQYKDYSGGDERRSFRQFTNDNNIANQVAPSERPGDRSYRPDGGGGGGGAGGARDNVRGIYDPDGGDDDDGGYIDRR